jgi:hypothetical protein
MASDGPEAWTIEVKETFNDAYVSIYTYICLPIYPYCISGIYIYVWTLHIQIRIQPHVHQHIHIHIQKGSVFRNALRKFKFSWTTRGSLYHFLCTVHITPSSPAGAAAGVCPPTVSSRRPAVGHQLQTEHQLPQLRAHHPPAQREQDARVSAVGHLGASQPHPG